jgi:hypothetical protein
MIVEGNIPNPFLLQKFKLSASSRNEPVELAIEFCVEGIIYYYSIAINEGMCLDEYFSKGQEDQLIFRRVLKEGQTTVTFFEGFEGNIENTALKKVIESDLLKPDKPLFTLLNSITNDAFAPVKSAYKWFNEHLEIITPGTKTLGLILGFEREKGFKQFAKEVIVSFDTGISNLKLEVKTIEEFFGRNNQDAINEAKRKLKDYLGCIYIPALADVILVNEGGKFLAKGLLLEHKDDTDQDVEFNVNEESNGTRRLLDYILALNNLIKYPVTYIIDEIESSIHPSLIKKLVEKFSKDQDTKGQLIFSTHESNLLDQDILRTDEIWFAEKNAVGSSEIYSLSDFKEHNTIDIRKGYLNGRYGAIPFLGSLDNLNWHKINEQK